MNELQSLYTIAQAAEHWHIGRTSVFHWINRHKIKTIKAGRKTLIPGSEIRRIDTESLRDPSQAA